MTTQTGHPPAAPASAPPRAGLRAWVGLAALLLPSMVILMDEGILFLALPRIVTDLRVDSAGALWIIDVYGFMVAAFMVSIGRLADRVGARRLLLFAAAAFCVFSLAAALAPNAASLIALRAGLGIAGAAIMPCLMALIKHMFPDPRQMATAMGMATTSAMVGVLLGPAAGGLLLASYGWRATFLIAVPVMLALLLVGPFALPEYRDPAAARLDAGSVALSLGAFLPVIYGITALARNGVSPLRVGAIAVGLAVGVAFVRRQRRLAVPLLDLGLLRQRAVGATVLMYSLVGIVQAGNGLTLTQHVQQVNGRSPFWTALLMAFPVGLAILSVQVATAAAKRTRPVRVLVAGLVVAAVGETVLAATMVDARLAVVVTGLSIVMLGTGPVGALSGQIVMHAAPADKAGVAGSLNGTGGTFGSAVGIALFGSLVTLFYSGHVPPVAGAGPAATAQAQESLAHAVAALPGLPADVAEALLAAARATFSTAIGLIAALCVVFFVVMAVFVRRTLREVPRFAAEQPAVDPETVPAA